jgi:hypothetical protein
LFKLTIGSENVLVKVIVRRHLVFVGELVNDENEDDNLVGVRACCDVLYWVVEKMMRNAAK